MPSARIHGCCSTGRSPATACVSRDRRRELDDLRPPQGARRRSRRSTSADGRCGCGSVAALDDSIFQGELVMSDVELPEAVSEQEGLPGSCSWTRAADRAGAIGGGHRSRARPISALTRCRRLSAWQNSTPSRTPTSRRSRRSADSGCWSEPIGLAAVLLRNVLERRRELALLGAVGFRRGAHLRHHPRRDTCCCSAWGLRDRCGVRDRRRAAGDARNAAAGCRRPAPRCWSLRCSRPGLLSSVDGDAGGVADAVCFEALRSGASERMKPRRPRRRRRIRRGLQCFVVLACDVSRLSCSASRLSLRFAPRTGRSGAAPR